MEEFYKDYTFILGFMILVLLVQMAFGEKAERGFLLATLFSMCILNVSKVNEYLDNLIQLDKEGKK